MNGTKTTINKLKKGTQYYALIRSRAKVNDDTTIKSGWSSKIKVTIK